LRIKKKGVKILKSLAKKMISICLSVGVVTIILITTNASAQTMPIKRCIDVPNVGKTCDIEKLREKVKNEISKISAEISKINETKNNVKTKIDETKKTITSKGQEYQKNLEQILQLENKKRELIKQGKLKEAALIQKLIESIKYKNFLLKKEIVTLEQTIKQYEKQILLLNLKLDVLQKNLNVLKQILEYLNQFPAPINAYK
jgi:chromosome segregation ATPase